MLVVLLLFSLLTTLILQSLGYTHRILDHVNAQARQQQVQQLQQRWLIQILQGLRPAFAANVDMLQGNATQLLGITTQALTQQTGHPVLVQLRIEKAKVFYQEVGQSEEILIWQQVEDQAWRFRYQAETGEWQEQWQSARLSMEPLPLPQRICLCNEQGQGVMVSIPMPHRVIYKPPSNAQ